MFSVRTAVVDQLPHLRRYALFLTRDPTLADDMVQESVARAIDRADQFRPGTNFRAWLFTILRSVFLNHQRAASRRHAVDIDGVAAPEVATRANQETRAELTRLEDALDELTPDHRDILLLIVVEGFTYEEAAEILDIALGTVRSRLARARGELNNRLRDPLEEDTAASAPENETDG
jgi:RNA polymerase sigma-70 factor (ECF subfamily)